MAICIANLSDHLPSQNHYNLSETGYLAIILQITKLLVLTTASSHTIKCGLPDSGGGGKQNVKNVIVSCLHSVN